MDILLYVLLGGSLAINIAVSAQVYHLHKSFLDLKAQLGAKDCKADASIRKQIDSELGNIIEKKDAEKSKSFEEDASRASTLFEGETVSEVVASISSSSAEDSKTIAEEREHKQQVVETVLGDSNPTKEG